MRSFLFDGTDLIRNLFFEFPFQSIQMMLLLLLRQVDFCSISRSLLSGFIGNVGEIGEGVAAANFA